MAPKTTVFFNEEWQLVHLRRQRGPTHPGNIYKTNQLPGVITLNPYLRFRRGLPKADTRRAPQCSNSEQRKGPAQYEAQFTV